MKSTSHMTIEERILLEELMNKNRTLYHTAQIIGRAQNTIRNELKRCPKGKYKAVDGQKHYEENLKKKHEGFRKKFTPQEENTILEMADMGLNMISISKRLKTSCRCIYPILDKHRKSNENVIHSLEQRVATLEQLVEILIDTIKPKQ